MKRARNVSEQAGSRFFVIAVLTAFLLGMLIRVSLAPEKVERFVRSKIDESPIRENLVFVTAQLSLADGAVPDLAIILHKVEWRLGGRCQDVAPIRARQLRVPLNIVGLFTGVISAGQVKADELTVDLDDLKRDCTPKTAVAKNEKTAVTPLKEAAANPSPETGEQSAQKVPGEVWTAKTQEQIAALVRGIRISRAEVFFENRMKSVILEDASAKWRGDSLDVSTALRFPPATVFGENLPTFAISGTVARTEMTARIRAELSEGAVEAKAVFRPVVLNQAKELDAEIDLSFSDLPLSVVTPLLSKSKTVTGAFRPKFVWLDCKAQIRGTFSRLFVENPVTLSACGISGQIGRISLEQATRLPNGSWEPFAVKTEKLDVARVLETFEIPGPSGVFANFGQVNGVFKVEAPELATFGGQLAGAVIRFAGGEGKALQPLAVDNIEAKLVGDLWRLSLTDFKPEGGHADLSLQASFDRKTHGAEIDVDLKELKLSPRVEKVVFTGPVSKISGKSIVALNLAESRLKKLKAGIVLQDWQGSELVASEVKIDSQLVSGGTEIEMSAKAPSIEVLKTGHLFRLLQPSLLGWQGESSADGKRIVVNRVAVKGRFRDGGFHWSGANASVGTQLALTSRGSVFRDHAIHAELEARFPLVSRLKWNVIGTWMNPKFENASPELGALFARAGLPRETVTASIPPKLLGLPKD